MDHSTFFTAFDQQIDKLGIPDHLILMNDLPHPLCVLAAKDLQSYLNQQRDWRHNFGLTADYKTAVVGKMFGVLVVQTKQGELGYLAAFSGKLAGKNTHHKFVPPIFDTLTDNSFLNRGMQELTRMNAEIAALNNETDVVQIKSLKVVRKNHSCALQQQIFEHYHLLNQAGEEKSLIEIFKNAGYINPPAGAGECAGPKLLQYAFQHQMKPLAMAEFWWGLSPKSDLWKHGSFYPCCREKCGPILKHMLT